MFERFKRVVSLSVFLVLPGVLFGIDASNRYLSPRNPERAIRKSTELIILHTTEGAEKGSLNKLCERGEAHYCVTADGTVYRIVERDREAFHAGRSMWNKKEDVDKFSIGIEVVGSYNKAMPMKQLLALRQLVKELKSMYHLSDDKVITHGHIAYGAPNRWHNKKHRGRKRCGMLFAMPSVRSVLGLKSRPAYDPDTRAKRLIVGDDFLRRALYTSFDSMKSFYGGVNVPMPAPRPASPGNKRTSSKPVIQAPSNKSQVKIALLPKSIDELKKRGYTQAGTVVKGKTISSIVGKKWNSATTYYTIRDKVIPGNLIDPQKIEVGMVIWVKK